MLKTHRTRDERSDTQEDQTRNAERIERLRNEAKRLREFLASHDERRSEKGAIRKSNVTDNDSAKMATAKGVIQGYTAVAAVDERSQIIVAAQAHGSGSEQSVLLPMVRKTDACAPIRRSSRPMRAITARRTCRRCTSKACPR